MSLQVQPGLRPEAAYLIGMQGHLAGARVLHDQLPGVQGVGADALGHVVPVEAQVRQDAGEVGLLEALRRQQERARTHASRVPHLRPGPEL